MGHGLLGGEESERVNIKLNTQHLGKHHFTVLQNCNCVFIRCWEQLGTRCQNCPVAGLDIYQLTAWECIHIYTAFVFLQSFNELPSKSYEPSVVHAHMLTNTDLNHLLSQRFPAWLTRDNLILNCLFWGI